MELVKQEIISNPNRLVDEKEAAQWTGMSVYWYQKMRWAGGGPPYTKLGSSKYRGAVRYRLGELLSWFEQSRVRSTSDPAAAANCTNRAQGAC